MALSNSSAGSSSTTGNKSELSVGYSTLYGDMAGGYALLKDIYKTDVFRLARYLNEQRGPRARSGVDHRAAAGAELGRTSATRTHCRRTRS